MLTAEETKAVALVVMAVVTLAMSFLPLYIRKVLSQRMAQTYGQVSRCESRCVENSAQVSRCKSVSDENSAQVSQFESVSDETVSVENSAQVSRFESASAENSAQVSAAVGCLCFGAGVLLSIVFLHLLPETRATLEYAMDADLFPHTHYPVAEVVLRERLPSEGPAAAQEAVGGHGSVRGVAVLMAVDGRVNEAFEGDGCTGGPVEAAARRNVHTVPHHHAAAVDKNVSVMGAVVVVVALSFHSVMEGLALGLEEEPTDVWILMAALTSHKVFIAFSMSMELLEVGVSLKPFAASMIVFSLASPVGGLIGALVVAYSGDQESAGAVLAPTFLQAVSGGTILYVAFCEVLERERAKPKGGMVRFLTLLLGFCLMAGLEAVGGHEHGHKSEGPTATVTP
ncbi:hypothetical protein C7M84_007809 [Penaeus vannamei]|uniref:Zinc transporter ZIP1 n=1 Tax=Penaeus vannamei TaxID=6689 RepID=A0A3R7M5U3_PENVA|nr:hypothetical protein C7M84_007809 [Penaeus vannamei]